MGQLIIMTTAERVEVTLAVGKSLQAIKPVPKHTFVTTVDCLPEAQEGDVVVAMGSKALAALQEAKLYPRNRGVASCRSDPVKRNGVWYVVSQDPFMIQVDAGAATEFAWDFRLADRLLRTDNPLPELGDYRYASDLSEVLEDVQELYEQAVERGEPDPRVAVAVDLETMGLVPWEPEKEIVTVQATAKPGKGIVVYVRGMAERDLKRLRRQLRLLLTMPEVKIIGANLKFDLIWLWVKWGIECTNFTMDVGLVGSILDENRSNSLNVLAKVYTRIGGYDDKFDRTHDKGKMETVPRADLLPYAAGDVDACIQAYDPLRSELINHRAPMGMKTLGGALTNFYVRLLHPATRAFERIETIGMCVNVEKFEQFGADLETAIAEAETVALSFLTQSVRQKYSDNLSLGRSALIVDQLFSPLGFNLTPLVKTEKSGKPSTAANHLSMFASHAEAGPFIKAFEEWSALRKMHSTYFVGFKKHLRPDHRWHPTYYLYQSGDEGGTVTGRTSARDPAVQTIPKRGHWAKRLRDCIESPPGFVIISADFDQGELRVAASWAQEPVMLEAYRRGIDLHALTAAQINGMEVEELMALKEPDPDKFEYLRRGGKAGNFGLLYGMGAEGWVEYAWNTYGVKVTLEEAQHSRGVFFDTYAGLSAWHERQRNEARTFGCVVSPLGRVRHLPLIRSSDRGNRARAERQAINSPIQSTLTDMCTRSNHRLIERYEDAAPFGMVHDQNLVYAPDDQIELWAERVTETMSTLPLREEFGWEPGIDFPADAEVGTTLANVQKL